MFDFNTIIITNTNSPNSTQTLSFDKKYIKNKSETRIRKGNDKSKTQLEKDLEYNAELRREAGLDNTRYIVREDGTTYTENPDDEDFDKEV
jgi:hypothetical protein